MGYQGHTAGVPLAWERLQYHYNLKMRSPMAEILQLLQYKLAINFIYDLICPDLILFHCVFVCPTTKRCNETIGAALLIQSLDLE